MKINSQKKMLKDEIEKKRTKVKLMLTFKTNDRDHEIETNFMEGKSKKQQAKLSIKNA